MNNIFWMSIWSNPILWTKKMSCLTLWNYANSSFHISNPWKIIVNIFLFWTYTDPFFKKGSVKLWLKLTHLGTWCHVIGSNKYRKMCWCLAFGSSLSIQSNNWQYSWHNSTQGCVTLMKFPKIPSRCPCLCVALSHLFSYLAERDSLISSSLSLSPFHPIIAT